jgi:hypothetical protein
MVSINLDEIKKQDPEDLEEKDVKTIQEGWDDLDETDKEKYKKYAPEDDKVKLEGDESGDDDDKGEGDDDKNKKKELPKAVLDEEKLKNIFKSQLDEYMAKRDPEKPITTDEKKWFGKDFNPKNWDELAEAFYPKVLERMTNEAKSRKSEQDAKIDKANKQITDELNKIEGMPAEGTQERVDFERDFTKFAIDYGVAGSIPKAYELYQTVKEKVAKNVPDSQKQTQSRVNKGGSGTSPTTPSRTYSKDVRNRSMDDIIADAAEKWNDLS